MVYESISTLMKGQVPPATPCTAQRPLCLLSHGLTLSLQQVDKKTMLDNLELVLLTIDEAVDHGYLMEMDATAIVGRVLMRGAEPHSAAAAQPVSIPSCYCCCC